LKSWLFQASTRNCLNCVHNCDDHSSLDIYFSFRFKLLAFTVKISHTPRISFSLTWVWCKLLPWQQTILKITIFWLFSTHLLPFLE